MQHVTITFIGAGNMAHSLIGGLVANGYPADRIYATSPQLAELSDLHAKFAINTTQDNSVGARAADVVLFAVKPQILKTVALELAPIINEKRSLVITIAAGIRETDLRHWLGDHSPAIVRCMPNIPAMIHCGATALYANPWVNSEQKNLAESILRAVGITLWLTDEHQLDVVTALSGNGPAYFFRVMEILMQSAEQLGLPHDVAQLLTLQTALGAARMALESPDSVTALRQRVTSPGGTTERALQVLEEGEIATIFAKALHAAQQRAVELAELFGK